MQYKEVFSVTGDTIGISIMMYIVASVFSFFVYLSFKQYERQIVSKGIKIICGVLAVICLVIGLITYKYAHSQYLLNTGDYSIVEGVVENFAPEPVGGHGLESFSIKGMKFEYGSGVITGGYNIPHWAGSPISEGSKLKLYHNNGLILRIETISE